MTTTTRTFRIARPLARLAARNGTPTQRVEGHFPGRQDNGSHVLVEPVACALVLRSGEGEERTDIPRSQAEALLGVAAGKLAAIRTEFSAAGQTYALDRYSQPDLDLVHVQFAQAGDAGAFQVPAWLGEEVTTREEYTSNGLAIGGRPEAAEVLVSDSGLDGLLDVLDLAREGDAQSAARDPRVEDVVEGLSRILSAPEAPVRIHPPAPRRAATAA